MEALNAYTRVRGALLPSPSSLQSLATRSHGSRLSSPAILPLTNPSACRRHRHHHYHHQKLQFTSRHERALQVYAENTARFYHDRNVRTRMWSSERTSQGSPVRAVPVQLAHELLNAGHHYLDVRTAEEFAAGHIEGAINIPYMHKAGPGMTKNLNFLKDVEVRFGKDAEIVVGCQLGKRSQMAAAELVATGFTGITDMAGGYAAWVQSGMPTKASV